MVTLSGALAAMFAMVYVVVRVNNCVAVRLDGKPVAEPSEVRTWAALTVACGTIFVITLIVQSL